MRRGSNRALGSLLGAWGLACCATWGASVALAVYAFEVDGAGGVAAAAAARLLPAMLTAAPLASVLDRHDRARLVALGCLVQAGALLLTGLLMLGHAPLAPVVGLAALGSAASPVVRPGLESLMPALSRSPVELTRAVARWSQFDNGGFLVGAGLAGAAIAVVSPAVVVLAAAAAITLATRLSSALPAGAALEHEHELEGDDAEDTGLLAGLRVIVAAPLLRAAFLSFALLLLLDGTTDVLLVTLALGRLQLGHGGPGELNAVWGVGGVLAGVTLPVFVRRRGYGFALILGGAAFGAGIALCGVPSVPVVVLAMIPAGIGFALVEAAITAVIPRLVDDSLVGRVYGVAELLYGGAAGAGALLAPLALSALGDRDGLVACGGVMLAATLLVLGACRRLDAGEERAERVRGLLHRVAFLEPLPLPRLERLVRGAEAVAFPAGAVVIVAGDVGDAYYVIEDGEVEIEGLGVTYGPGSGFGEIALLHDVPRTATVRGVTELRLWRVTRRAFLAAVGASSEAARRAEAVVAERLARGATGAEALRGAGDEHAAAGTPPPAGGPATE